MDHEEHFDVDEMNDEDEENFDEQDYDDEDVVIDDYEGQNRDINDFAKDDNDEDEDEDETLFDINEEQHVDQIYSNVKRKSNIKKMSKYEHTHLIGTLATYISDSKISVPDEMKHESVVSTGSAVKIAFFWVENRKKYNIPIELKRQITNTIVEIIKPDLMIIDEDFDFKDDFDDTASRFHQNFRENPYDNDV